MQVVSLEISLMLTWPPVQGKKRFGSTTTALVLVWRQSKVVGLHLENRNVVGLQVVRDGTPLGDLSYSLGIASSSMSLAASLKSSDSRISFISGMVSVLGKG